MAFKEIPFNDPKISGSIVNFYGSLSKKNGLGQDGALTMGYMAGSRFYRYGTHNAQQNLVIHIHTHKYIYMHAQMQTHTHTHTLIWHLLSKFPLPLHS